MGSYRNIVTFETPTAAVARVPPLIWPGPATKSDTEMNIAEASRQLGTGAPRSGDEKKRSSRPLGNTHSAKICPTFRLCGVWSGGGLSIGVLPQRQPVGPTSFGISIVIIFGYYLAGLYHQNAMGEVGHSFRPFHGPPWLPTAGGRVVPRGLYLLFKAFEVASFSAR